MKRDRNITKAAVKQYGLALEFASEDLRGNRDIAMTAVNQVGERSILNHRIL